MKAVMWDTSKKNINLELKRNSIFKPQSTENRDNKFNMECSKGRGGGSHDNKETFTKANS